MQENNQAKTKKILLELAVYLKVKGIQGLAASLGENPNKLYAWVKNGNVGDTGCILGKHPEIRKDWLETGEGEMLLDPAQPTKISEQLIGFSPDIKLIADSIEIQVQGKTAAERAEFIKGVMEQIWGRGK